MKSNTAPGSRRFASRRRSAIERAPSRDRAMNADLACLFAINVLRQRSTTKGRRHDYSWSNLSPDSVNLRKLCQQEIAKHRDALRITEFLRVDEEHVDFRWLQVAQHFHQVTIFRQHEVRNCADSDSRPNC